jgi:hypothetical protein
MASLVARTKAYCDFFSEATTSPLALRDFAADHVCGSDADVFPWCK